MAGKTSEMVSIKSSAADSFTFGALHARPAGQRKAGVIVVQEIFGLDRYVVEDVERWSERGFEVLAPALFDRVERGWVGDHDPEGFRRGREIRAEIPFEVLLGDIDACVRFLAPHGPVFLVGYCLGGSIGWMASGRVDGLAAVSSYYGGMIAQNLDVEPKCPIICHFGRKDGHIPADSLRAAIRTAHPEVPVYIYENSGHGFNNDGRPDSDASDAELARRRTVELFEKHGAR